MRSSLVPTLTEMTYTHCYNVRIHSQTSRKRFQIESPCKEKKKKKTGKDLQLMGINFSVAVSVDASPSRWTQITDRHCRNVGPKAVNGTWKRV